MNGYLNDLNGYLNDLNGYLNDLDGYLNDLNGDLYWVEWISKKRKFRELKLKEPIIYPMFWRNNQENKNKFINRKLVKIRSQI